LFSKQQKSLIFSLAQKKSKKKKLRWIRSRIWRSLLTGRVLYELLCSRFGGTLKIFQHHKNINLPFFVSTVSFFVDFVLVSGHFCVFKNVRGSFKATLFCELEPENFF
jgi:hypothetical protein